MYISESIHLNVEEIIKFLYKRQVAPWNGGVYFDDEKYYVLNELFNAINTPNMNRFEYMYRGDIYRIHCSSTKLKEDVDFSKERIVGTICKDGSCSVLPITEYHNSLASFSKCSDFTSSCYYKIMHTQTAVIFHANTGNRYGIDVNAFLNYYGYENSRFAAEQEVLFPMSERYILKEYLCSPNQFKYYMRKRSR